MKKAVLVGLIVNHHSFYSYIISILLKDFEEVLFISKSRIIEQINVKQENLKIIANNERINLVFKKNIELINQHDVFITDEYNGALVKLRNIKFTSPIKILAIHNANRWSKINFNPFNKYFIDQYFKFQFLKQFDALITLEPNVQDYYLKQKKDKPVFFLPFSIAEASQFENNIVVSSEIKILIPGTIDNTRRNYLDLLNVFEQYLIKSKNSKIKLVFLGRIFSDKDKNISILAGRINKTFNNKIKYWTSFIEQEEFDREVKSSQLILSNIYPEIKVQGITEFYGTSKGTGISYVYYSHAIPGIAPSFQKVMKGFEKQFIKFKTYNDLKLIFENLDNNKYNLAELKEKAIENSKAFNTLYRKETDRFIQYIT